MQETAKSSICNTFFAAANGYSGFRSYFPDVFPSSEFEHIFILKGGPGTGKSSLMKSISSFGIAEGYFCEKILCSSDPHSLDGVILEKDKKRFAILDGTAPHTRDADIPGTVDELVNLGENWNDELLKKNKKLIIELNKRKKNNYTLAYEHLNYAGAVYSDRCKLESHDIRYDILIFAAKNQAEILFKNERSGKRSKRLVNSFGRFGIFGLDTHKALSSETVSVKRRGYVTRIYMKALEDELSRLGCSMTVFPSVFDEKEIDALFLHESKTVILISDSEKVSVDPIEFCVNNPNINIPEEFSSLYQALLEEARKFFSFASDLHFELEKLYTASMNFDKNNEISEKIIEKIKKLSS